MSKLTEEKPEKEDLNNLDKKEETANSSNPEIEKKYFEFDDTTTNELITKRKSHILWLIGIVALGFLFSLMSGIEGTYEKGHGLGYEYDSYMREHFGKSTTTEDIMGFARLLIFILVPPFGFVIYYLTMKWKNFSNSDDLKKFKEIEYAKITSENLSIKNKNGEISNDKIPKCNLLLNQYKWAMLFIGFSFLLSSVLIQLLAASEGAIGAIIFFVLVLGLLVFPYWYWHMRMDGLLEEIKKTIPWHKSPS